MTFGGLMMAVGAFNQVHSSLRWFIDNIGGIADWRATLDARRRFPARADQDRRAARRRKSASNSPSTSRGR